MNKRPTTDETESDILVQQALFLKNLTEPSVKLVKSDELVGKTTCNRNKSFNEIEEKTPCLLGKIVERQSKPPDDTLNFVKCSRGFPEAKKRQMCTSSKKESIFSKQNKKLKKSEKKNLPKQSFIISGEQKDEIHKENIEKISQMEEEEILNEQKQLLLNLDPKIIQFLKSKRQGSELHNKTIDNDIDIEVYKEPIMNIKDLEIPKSITDQAENWINFNCIETEKLQWMKNIDIPKKPDLEEYEARFDFQGWILPYSENITEKNRILYHHGEEPGRPGYTLKELFKLARSNIQQQRIISLNTISNILCLYSTGAYDQVIDLPLEQIFFILRVSVDDNTPTILNASMKALHHLFYNQIDETYLDILLCYGICLRQPVLTIERDISKDDKLNDQQLAELDLIKCLVRTDILTRIKYIVNTIKPNTETITFCLELLIRLTRDSEDIFLKVYNCENLFSTIIKNFLPKIYKLEESLNNCYGKPLIQAIKFIRLSCCRSRKIAEDLVKRYNILESVSSYIANNITENSAGIKIQIESFRLLQVIYFYNIGVDYFLDLKPFLLQTIDYHYRNTNCGERSSFLLQTHFTSAINLISQLSKINYLLISNFLPILMQCFIKFSNQTTNLTNFESSHLQIISALIITLTNIVKNSPIKRNDILENSIFELISSKGFNKITENIKLSSNLLSDYQSHKSSPNLATIESALWSSSDHIIPCLNSKSALPFLCAISNFFEISNGKTILKFLQNENIKTYLFSIKNISKFNLTSNWFTKLESLLILNILKNTPKVQKELTDSFLFYELSVKCLNVFNVEQKLEIDYLLQNIVFNKKFFPSEVLLQHMTIGETKDIFSNKMAELQNIYTCYSDVLGLKQGFSIFLDNLILNINSSHFIPVDWIFSPIILLYSLQSVQNQQKGNESDELLIVNHTLQWILIYETFFPQLASFINITERFCRLCCVFLLDSNLFLHKNINYLLELCLKCLIQSNHFKNLNFEREIQGLNNFQDFYIQLLEQYQGVSYSDKVFANFVLIPLTQRNNVKWRKILWSEYLAVAQTINLELNETFIELKEFVEPLETDISLLNSYKRALMCNQLQRSPFLKTVACYHLKNCRNQN